EAGYRDDPQRVWDWYQYRRELVMRAEPNAGHHALANWAQAHPQHMTVITQNVDGLHQRAGQPATIALHGSLMDDQWLDAPQACCESQAPMEGRPPRCASCGNLRRPAVVWFGEHLPPQALSDAERAVAVCGVMLVVGTSGQVYPAAGLAFAAHQQGARVVVLNTEESELDRIADTCLQDSAAESLPFLLGGI